LKFTEKIRYTEKSLKLTEKKSLLPASVLGMVIVEMTHRQQRGEFILSSVNIADVKEST
jgi:hypothetical protein